MARGVAATRARARVLLVEDDGATRYGLASSLRLGGYEVLEAESAADALRQLSARPDVVITDLRLPDRDAVGLLPDLRAIDPDVPVYIITGFATIDTAVQAVKLGAEDFFTKPVTVAKLIECIERAISRSGPNSADRQSGREVTRTVAIKARSEVMCRLDDEVERLRSADCTVLILGETGTGKSVLARRIHQLGDRRNGPFVDVNCAAFSKEFVESELFGHVRGAFTGAHGLKQGLFEVASEGTLFLDEIGDIDTQVQPKVLKAIEEKRYRRMGDTRERTVDVRLIAATHHDLFSAVERGSFRADLFYRISTVTIRLPSLRERLEDLPEIVEQLLTEQGAPHVPLARDAWDKIKSYAWPGNLRELKNVLHRALILRDGEAIAGSDVRFDNGGRSSGGFQAATPADGPLSTRTLEAVEREHITNALVAENGRVKDAARRLGIPRSTLYQKIKNYGISLPARPRGSQPPDD
jgi:DNA-binding NtrC family response regulator